VILVGSSKKLYAKKEEARNESQGEIYPLRGRFFLPVLTTLSADEFDEVDSGLRADLFFAGEGMDSGRRKR